MKSIIPYDLAHPVKGFLEKLSATSAELPKELYLKGKVLRKTENLPGVSALSVYRVTADEVARLKNFKDIRALALGRLDSSNLNCLAGLPNLQHLIIYESPKLTSLHGLENLKTLQSLWLWDLRGLRSLAGVESQFALQEFQVDHGWQKSPKLDSLEPIRTLVALKRLSIGGIQFQNEDFSVLFDLKNLSELKITKDYKLESLATIAAAQGQLVDWVDGSTSDTSLTCLSCSAPCVALLGKRSKYSCTVCDRAKIEKFKVKFSALVTSAQKKYRQSVTQAVIN